MSILPIPSAPIKTLFLKGTLKNGLASFLVNVEPFQKGVWQVSLDSISFDIPELSNLNINYLCSLSCNWITSETFNSLNQLITESPCIFQFNIIRAKDCIFNTKTWFEINALTQFIIFEILDLDSNSPFLHEGKINILLQIQRKQ